MSYSIWPVDQQVQSLSASVPEKCCDWPWLKWSQPQILKMILAAAANQQTKDRPEKTKNAMDSRNWSSKLTLYLHLTGWV